MSESEAGKFTVIYDGDCGFCQRSLKRLRSTDVLDRFTYLDFHEKTEVERRFPSLRGADFENAMYAIDPAGRSFRGYFAFRRLIWASPLLWPLIPLFYFPGASLVGPKVYAWIANHRSRLACKID